ncbi:MAG: hypothetical protein ABUK01_02700, partial [Leptospirales bacterium]
ERQEKNMADFVSLFSLSVKVWATINRARTELVCSSEFDRSRDLFILLKIHEEEDGINMI